MNSRIGKSFAMAAVVAALTLSISVPRVHADDDGRRHCQRAIEKLEARLDRAVQRDGWRSHEAEERRRDLHAERERCWNKYHEWWNGREHRWERSDDFDRYDRRDRDDDRRY